MHISNAKYEKKHSGVKNRAYISDHAFQSGMDLSDFEIPRYEEMKFLRLEDFEE